MTNEWHVVARSQNLPEGSLLAVQLFGEGLVLWRCAGRPMAWQDRCAHRGARLSLGTIADGTLVCSYHGWRYAPDGRCVAIPAQPGQPPPPDACVTTYAVQERDGFIWVCAAEPPAAAGPLRGSESSRPQRGADDSPADAV